MFRCIYCNKTDQETNFNNEHVIPRFLGTFEPLSPVLRKDHGLVCGDCNSTFSHLENLLKEDTEEGLYAQQLNLENKNSIRIRGQRLVIDCVPGFGDKFFNEMFPFLKIENGEVVVDLKSQIKIRNFADGYQVFLIDALRTIRDNPVKFREFQQRLAIVPNTNISIFTGGNELGENNLNEIIDLLRDFNINYNEHNRRYAPVDHNPNQRWEFSLDSTIDHEIGRVLAKIAFNYFAYCALQEEKQSALFDEEFGKIRRFINGDTTIPLTEILKPSEQDCILDIERNTGKRLIAHIITFKTEGRKIKAMLSLFGKRIYEIEIGDIPTEWLNDTFGCGHYFEPFSRSILNLSQQPARNPTAEQIRLSFGLFKRI